MNTSYWEKYLLAEAYDLLIIGSGIVGMTCAIHAKKCNPAARIAILERGFQPWGASTRNAGFACFGSLSEIFDDLMIMHEQAVLDLILERWNGLKLLQDLVKGYDIGLENNGGYEVFTDELFPLFDKCINSMPKINKMLYQHFEQNVFTSDNSLINGFGFKGVNQIIKNPFESQLHTGKLIAALCDITNKMNIEQLFGAQVNRWLETESSINVQVNDNFELKTKKMVVATNGFVTELLPNLEVKPTRAQVLITDEIPSLKVKGCFHMDRGYYYFRNIDNRILFGGARNIDLKNEYTLEAGTSELIQKDLEHRLKTIILPNSDPNISLRWSGTMGTGNSKAPIIEHVSNHVVAAVRLGGMGVAIGSLVGKRAAELINA
jgi:gamma-glutamylputrescine oxidase